MSIRKAPRAVRALVFTDIELDDAGQQRFASHFGPLTTAHPTVPAVEGAPNILPVDSEQGRANHWHTDVTFVLNPPQASALRSITVLPHGGETPDREHRRRLPRPAAGTTGPRRRADRGAHQRLRLRRPRQPQAGRRRRAAQGVPLQEVRDGASGGAGAPADGERGLFIGGFAQRIVGLSGAESLDILRILQSYVARPENIVRVGWTSNRLVLFDNRITQHCAVDNYDDLQRRLHRVTVAGDIPVGVTREPSYSITGDAAHYTDGAAAGSASNRG